MTGPVTALSTDEGADLRSRVARLSLEQKVRLLTGGDFWALHPEPDAGLRRVVLSSASLPLTASVKLKVAGCGREAMMPVPAHRRPPPSLRA